MSRAVNYVETVEFTYPEYAVSPDIEFGTIARFTGNWTVRVLNCEWCSPTFIEQQVARLNGWVVEMGQPSKPDEAIDMLNVTITAKKRTA